MLRQDFKQTPGNFDAVSVGNAAEMGGVPAVATNADAKRCDVIDSFSAQAYVGGNTVETERSAAIDCDRHFGGKSLRQRTLCERNAQIGGKRSGVDDFLGIETSQRIRQNRDAVSSCDAEIGDRRCETRRSSDARPPPYTCPAIALMSNCQSS